DLHRLCGKKWILAISRVLGDGQILGFDATREYRQAQISNFDITAERFARLGLHARLELIRIDKKGQRDHSENENSNDNTNCDDNFAHGSPRDERYGTYKGK